MDNINFKQKEIEIDTLVKKYLEDKKIFDSMPGYISVFWNVKKRFFKELYNINWKSPEDLNSDVIFD